MRGVFALTTRGLESISAGELDALPGVTTDRIAYRRVTATCTASLTPLLGLRTVDDVFIDAGTWADIGRARSALGTIGTLSAELRLSEAADACGELRRIATPPSFSVTVSFVGKRNYSTAEIKKVCAKAVGESHSWSYTSNDAEADLNVRVFIEHSHAFVGVRLGGEPLHRRRYKRSHVPGSLKPPVAAALLALAGVRSGTRVLDPCCGAGTILIEAALSGATAQGGDYDLDAIEATRSNAVEAEVDVSVQRWNTCHLPVADASVETIVSNLPWGRAVKASTTLRSFYQQVCPEMQRVLGVGGRIALLSNVSELVELPALRCTERFGISLFGQRPTISVFSS